MTKQIYLSSLLVSVCIAFAQAQQQPEQLADSFKQDIGFNTSFILSGIFNSNQTPFSLMYKRYIHEYKAVRYGINMGFNIPGKIKSDSPVTTGFSTRIEYKNLQLSIGEEFQKKINTRWIWYYGGDLVVSYYKNASENYQNGTLYQEARTTTYEASARPFLGIRYAIHSRLYLSAEASIALAYGHTDQFSSYNDGQTTQAQINDYSFSNLSFSMRPASGIFLYYRF